MMATTAQTGQLPNKSYRSQHLKSLGQLAEAQPIIEIDSREQTTVGLHSLTID